MRKREIIAVLKKEATVLNCLQGSIIQYCSHPSCVVANCPLLRNRLDAKNSVGSLCRRFHSEYHRCQCTLDGCRADLPFNDDDANSADINHLAIGHSDRVETFSRDANRCNNLSNQILTDDIEKQKLQESLNQILNKLNVAKQSESLLQEQYDELSLQHMSMEEQIAEEKKKYSENIESLKLEIECLKTDFNFVTGRLVSTYGGQPTTSEFSHESRLKELSSLAKYVAEGFLYSIQLRNEPPYANQFNIENIRDYSSLGFIRKCSESLYQDSSSESSIDHPQSDPDHFHEIDCSLFVSFMYEVMQNLQKSSTTTKDNQNKIDHMISLCLASVFAVGDKKFKWELSWIQSFLLKSISHSSKAVDLLSVAFPGGVTNSQLWDNMNTFMNAILLQGLMVDGSTTLLVQFDNVGIYRPKQRSASADRLYQVSVMTSVMGFHLIKDEAELIQKSHKHSPLMWKPLKQLSIEEFCIEGTQLEQNIFMREVIFILTSALEDVVDGCGEDWNDPVVRQPNRQQPININDVHAPTVEEYNNKYPKVCPDCGKRNVKFASYCGNKDGKDGGCGAPLPTISQMNAVLATCSRTKFLKPSRRKVLEACNYTDVWQTEPFNQNTSTIIESSLVEERHQDSCISVEKVQETKFKSGKIVRKPLANSRRKIARMIPEYDFEDTGTTSAMDNEPSDVLKVEMQTWPCVDVNPNDQPNIKHVVDEICRIARVRDFVDDDMVEREFIFIGSDNGARIQINPNNDKDSKYRRIHIIPGTGHEFTNLCQMVYDMGWNYGLHHHAELAGLGPSEDVWKYLRKGKDVHRMMDFLINTSLIAHAKAFAREFLQEWKHTASEGQLPSVTEFVDYLNDDGGDVMFKNGRDFWLFKVVPALSLMIKSQRNNFKAGYDAGKKQLLPLCFVRNHKNYGKDIIEDIANDVRSTSEVKAVINEFFTVLGEGFDYRLESRNKDIEADVQGTPSLRSYQNAAFSSGLTTQLLTVYSNTTATDEKARKVPFGRKQHEVDAADSNIQCELWQNRLWKKNPNRDDLRSYDNRTNSEERRPQFKLLPDAGIETLLNKGKDRLNTFLNGYIEEKDQTFPQRVPMTVHEAMPVVKNNKRRKSNPEIREESKSDVEYDDYNNDSDAPN